MKNPRNDGGALIAVVMILPLISIGILFLNKVKTYSVRREQVISRIMKDAADGLAPPTQLTIQLQDSEIGSTAPFLLFDGTNQSSAFLIRINTTSNPIPHPSWRRLSRFPTLDCTTTTPTTQIRPSLAPVRCNTSVLPIEANRFSPYNIDQTSPFEIQTDPNESVTIGIAGEFNAPVNILLAEGSRVALITLGSLSINTLNLNAPAGVAGGSVLLSSKIGGISINQIFGADLCGGVAITGVKMRLEAPGGITLGGAAQPAPTVGCTVTRDPYIWPKSQVIAMYYP